MANEFDKNNASLNYGNSPELLEEFSSLRAGDSVSAKITGTVRRNEDETLEIDVTDVVLPESGPTPVTTDVRENQGTDVVGEVLNKESPARGELAKDS